MSEWWTYRLSDFLLFAPRTYYRLFELYNADIWPAQIAAPALGVAILMLLFRADAGAARIAAVILAAAWLWVAWAFHFERYATINWAAVYFAAGFALQALLLLWTGVVRGGLRFLPVSGVASRIGLGVFLFALVAQPLIGPLPGRAWMGVELFGLAPDPTAVGTLGLLLVADRVRWTLLAMPLAWCAITGATLWAMAAPDALIAPAAALVVVCAACIARIR
jgi:hypothetical protein